MPLSPQQSGVEQTRPPFNVGEARMELASLRDRAAAGEDLDLAQAEAEIAHRLERALSDPDPLLSDPAFDPER